MILNKQEATAFWVVDKINLWNTQTNDISEKILDNLLDFETNEMLQNVKEMQYYTKNIARSSSINHRSDEQVSR